RAGGLFLALLFRLFERHQVELPSGELARQPDVLPGAADRLREVLLVDDDIHAVFFFIDGDLAYFRRRERIDDELRGIGGPQPDVPALAAELRGYRLHARSAHADARAYGIDARIVGLHGDLGTRSRIACSRLDLEQPVFQLRHF